MRLYLIRHPRPLVAPDVCYGRTDLTVAQEEIAAVRTALLPHLPHRAPLFTSPLQRCTELSASLAQQLDCITIRHDQRLAEMHFGDWEMQTWEQIPRPDIEAWSQDLAGYRPGGGESVLEVAQRVRDFRDDLAGMELEHAIIVCHAGIIRLLMACEQSLSVAEMALHAAQKPHKIGYGELLIIDC